MAERKINKCLNFAKGIACVLVVFIHSQFPQPVGKYVICVARAAVPLFFMVSGYFCCFDSRDILFEKMPHKIKHIAKLAFGAVMLYIVWDFAKIAITHSTISAFTAKFTGRRLLQFLIFNNTDAVNTALWFFFALLYCYILYYAINKLNLLKLFYFLIPVLFIVFYALLHAESLFGKAVPTCYYRNAYFEGFPFFLLGNLMFKYKEKIKQIGAKFAFLITCAGLAGSIIEQMRYKNWLPCLYLTSVLFVGGVFMLCIVYEDKNINSPIEKLGGKYSLYVYLFHPIFFALLGMIQFKVLAWRYFMPLAVLSLSIIVSIAYVSVKNKICLSVKNKQ